MSNMVTLKKGDTFYTMPVHEFTRHWLPNYDMGVIEVKDVPSINEMNRDAVLYALKRGKGVKRTYKAYHAVGSGKHATLIH